MLALHILDSPQSYYTCHLSGPWKHIVWFFLTRAICSDQSTFPAFSMWQFPIPLWKSSFSPSLWCTQCFFLSLPSQFPISLQWPFVTQGLPAHFSYHAHSTCRHCPHTGWELRLESSPEWCHKCLTAPDIAPYSKLSDACLYTWMKNEEIVKIKL